MGEREHQYNLAKGVVPPPRFCITMASLRGIFNEQHSEPKQLQYERPKQNLTQLIFTSVVHVFKYVDGSFTKAFAEPAGLAVVEGPHVIIYDTLKNPICEFVINQDFFFYLISDKFVKFGDDWCFQMPTSDTAGNLICCLTVTKGQYLCTHNLSEHVCITNLNSVETPLAIKNGVLRLVYKLWELSEAMVPLESVDSYVEGDTEYHVESSTNDLILPTSVNDAFQNVQVGQIMVMSYFNSFSNTWFVAKISVAECADDQNETEDRKIYVEEKTSNRKDIIHEKLDEILDFVRRASSKPWIGERSVIEAVSSLVEDNSNKDSKILSLEKQVEALQQELQNTENIPQVGNERELLEKCANASRLQLQVQEKYIALLNLHSDLKESMASSREDYVQIVETVLHGAFVDVGNMDDDAQFSGQQMRTLLKRVLKNVSKEIIKSMLEADKGQALPKNQT